MTLLELLQVRYDISQNAKGNDDAFYTALYDYLDLIVRTPELSSVMSEESKKLSARIEEIKSDPYLSIYAKEELDDRAKRESVYPKYMYLYMNLYLTIKDHAAGQPVRNQEMLMVIHGIEKLSQEKRQFEYRVFDYWRDNFTRALEQLHDDLTEVIKNQATTPDTAPDREMPFTFDVASGRFRFKDLEGVLAPSTNEYRVLTRLWSSKGQQATYAELLSAIGSNAVSKIDKRRLTFTLRNLKQRFCILPVTKKSNPDIFENLRGYGYRLNFSEKIKRS